jgi:predicted TIM-barrel fold metal-dependent hydrolase
MRRMEAATLSDLIQDMDRADVGTSLVVLQEETEEFFHLAAQHPGRLFGLAYYDSRFPGQGLEQVRTLCDGHPGLIVGVTTAFPFFHQDPRLNDFVPLYEYCLQRDLAVQFHLGDDPTGGSAGHPMALAVLAKTYPRLKVVCLHAGGRHGDLPGLLARLPNLFLQAEALQDAEAEGDGEPRILRTVVRAAGGRKLMFGSNWRGRDERYLQRVETVRRLPWWQRKNVGWRTAARVYGPRLLSG